MDLLLKIIHPTRESSRKFGIARAIEGSVTIVAGGVAFLGIILVEFTAFI